MKHALLALCVAAVALSVALGCGRDKSTDPDDHSTSGITWVSTAVAYDTLITKHDLTLIFFYTTWCGYCGRMDRETFADPAVRAVIAESYNAIRINCEADSSVTYFDTVLTCGELADRYGVHAWPMIAVLDRRGDFLGPIYGYRQPVEFITILNAIIEMYPPGSSQGGEAPGGDPSIHPLKKSLGKPGRAHYSISP